MTGTTDHAVVRKALPQRLWPARVPAQWTTALDVPPVEGPLPRITVVTPSYNQAAFLESTIRSVLEQSYPALDYHVIDGGSSDGSADVIRHYAPWLASWICERDDGQVDAILKGLKRADGEWFNWINSDDLLAPGALWEVARLSQGDLIAGATQNFREDALDRRRISRALNARDLVRIPIESRTRWHQPGIWYRTAALREVGIDTSLHYRFDLKLLIRYTLRFPCVRYTDRTLAWFRLHGASKTVSEAARFGGEHRFLLEQLLLENEARHLQDDVRAALEALTWRQTLSELEAPDGRSRSRRLLEWIRQTCGTKSAWHNKATYDTLGRILRGTSKRP